MNKKDKKEKNEMLLKIIANQLIGVDTGYSYHDFEYLQRRQRLFYTSGSGRRTRILEDTHRFDHFESTANLYGLSVVKGNDAPRGGRLGYFIELTESSKKNLKKIEKEYKKALQKKKDELFYKWHQAYLAKTDDAVISSFDDLEEAKRLLDGQPEPELRYDYWLNAAREHGISDTNYKHFKKKCHCVVYRSLSKKAQKA